MFSVTVAQITVGFFALDRLRLDSADAARVAGIALTAVGVALILAQLLVRRLDWPPPRLIRVGGLVAAIGFAAVCFADSPPLLWLAFFVAAAGMGWSVPGSLGAQRQCRARRGTGCRRRHPGGRTWLRPDQRAAARRAAPPIDSRAPYALVGLLLALAAFWPSQPTRPVETRSEAP